MTGLIQDFFVKTDKKTIGHGHALKIDFENSLRRSRFESSRYEFKVGICTLSDRPAVEAGIYEKLARTAAAVANCSPDADGYIYLGVADKQSAVDRLRALGRTGSVLIGNVSFVGVGHDLDSLGMSLEEYVKRLIRELQTSKLADPLKTQLVTCIDHAEHCGMPFVRIRVPKQGDLTAYDGEYPIRKNSDTVNMTAAEAIAQAKLFR